MKHATRIIPVLAVALACVQAWDSRVLHSTPLVQALVALAIALPAVALVLPAMPTAAWIAVGLSVVALLVAKLMSPVPLPALGVIELPLVLGLASRQMFGPRLDRGAAA
jgi:hypothetical protein